MSFSKLIDFSLGGKKTRKAPQSHYIQNKNNTSRDHYHMAFTMISLRIDVIVLVQSSRTG